MNTKLFKFVAMTSLVGVLGATAAFADNEGDAPLVSPLLLGGKGAVKVVFERIGDDEYRVVSVEGRDQSMVGRVVSNKADRAAEYRSK